MREKLGLISPVEGAVLDGLGNVLGGEGVHAVEVGDGARDILNADLLLPVQS